MANTSGTETQLLETNSLVYQFSFGELIRVAVIGGVVGAATSLLANPIARYIIDPLFCRNKEAFGFCAEGGSMAFGIALIVLSVGALLMLASFRVYQPLLNILAPLAALWGLDQAFNILSSQHKLEFYLMSALLFAAAYALFYLLLRVRNFAASLILVVALIVAIRLQL